MHDSAIVVRMVRDGAGRSIFAQVISSLLQKQKTLCWFRSKQSLLVNSIDFLINSFQCHWLQREVVTFGLVPETFSNQSHGSLKQIEICALIQSMFRSLHWHLEIECQSCKSSLNSCQLSSCVRFHKAVDTSQFNSCAQIRSLMEEDALQDFEIFFRLRPFSYLGC